MFLCFLSACQDQWSLSVLGPSGQQMHNAHMLQGCKQTNKNTQHGKTWVLFTTSNVPLLFNWRLFLVGIKDYEHLERKRGGGWCFFTQVEPYWPMLYTVQYRASTMVEGCQTGGLGHLLQNIYARVQCREPKTGQKKVQLCCEDNWLWPSCYYLSMIWVQSFSGAICTINSGTFTGGQKC